MIPLALLTLFVLLVLTWVVAVRLGGRWAVRRASRALPPRQPDDVEGPAGCVTQPFAGPGVLRLTTDALLFARVSGPLLTLERDGIIAAFASDDVPNGHGMSTLRKPALVLQLDDPTLPQGVGFAVVDPAEWVAAIRSGRGHP